MLSLKKITKVYESGNDHVFALNGVSLQFRKSEFVSVLGPSGCGKTTLLNIIGGLDQYTRGDLVINGVSTKKYSDKNWDNYRNHSVGFVFQSYNLIPHQTVLANVELALTLSGISAGERRRRAIDALKQVGLSDQLKKRPNQMSGGQMQRVAIARALVNDPDILLADEPTGALDTQTSVQIMDLLHNIARKKLVIMVTHNPELAYRYSSRIIKLLDGKVISDSNPYQEPKADEPVRRKRRRALRSMSFFTALSLSLNNLMTKKTRTFMTSFAGSIGIIGIALILSVSSGVNAYINSVQRDTLASYPIELEAESTDMTALVTALMGAGKKEDDREKDPNRVYESAVMADLLNSINTAESTTNDLTAFKQYLETSGKFDEYLSAVQYTYDFNWNVLVRDSDGKVVKSDVQDLFVSLSGGMVSDNAPTSSSPLSANKMYKGFQVWNELLEGKNGEPVNDLIKEEYDLIYGKWPGAYNEVVLVVSKENEISDLALYALGLRTGKEIKDGMLAASKGETFDKSLLKSWSFEELCNMEFRLLLATECYQKQANGTFADLTESDTGMDLLYRNPTIGTTLKVVGILRPNNDATSTILNGNIAYTKALSDYALNKTASSEMIKEQLANREKDIISGLAFADTNEKDLTKEEKKDYVKTYVNGLAPQDRANLFVRYASTPTKEQVDTAVQTQLSSMTTEQIKQMMVKAFAAEQNIDEATAAQYLENISEADLRSFVSSALSMRYIEQYRAEAEKRLEVMNTAQLNAAFDAALDGMTVDEYADFYADFLPSTFSESTYEDNLKHLGYVKKDSPDSIKLYASSFENKDTISDLIAEYNKTVPEEKQISYTDYVALLMSSVTTIVNAISYVLIAFVAISLVVSSIMIGIITYISVLERTKEIGILRSIGASKRDVGRVFNAETLIVGFVAGVIGIAATLLLNLLINVILFRLTGIANLKAVLPVGGAIILVAISMFLTFIAGLVPSGIAARRNPVEALRTE